MKRTSNKPGKVEKAPEAIAPSSAYIEYEKDKLYALLVQFDLCAPELKPEMVIEWDENGLPQ